MPKFDPTYPPKFSDRPEYLEGGMFYNMRDQFLYSHICEICGETYGKHDYDKIGDQDNDCPKYDSNYQKICYRYRKRSITFDKESQTWNSCPISQINRIIT